MAPRNDPARIRTAKLTGAAMAVRDEIMRADPAAVEAQREALPKLWERIDSLIDLLG
ncbi:hypothetical protein [Aquihabitans sp. McL0605]|uniref:hypothetical protein n=1 Tax=Aquihabitans sp. McL0605 TaxID=3415671 RepID=UPI003CF93A17